MQVPKKEYKYMIDGRVRFSEIDHTRKITVPSIINYFQDCSTFQSEDIGVGLDVLSKKKKSVDSDLLADCDRSLSKNE